MSDKTLFIKVEPQPEAVGSTSRRSAATPGFLGRGAEKNAPNERWDRPQGGRARQSLEPTPCRTCVSLEYIYIYIYIYIYTYRVSAQVNRAFGLVDSVPWA